MFRSASECAQTEIEGRRERGKNLLRYGIDFLDDALLGITKNDLIVIGAPSGLGKTQLCCNMALANLEIGKRVHYIALEAEPLEIERRLKYPLVAERFFADPNRPRIRIAFDTWMNGDHIDELEVYEKSAAEYFAQAYRDLHIYYKQAEFTVPDLIEQVVTNSAKTDLIIVDHVHYFDFDDDNENRAMKTLAKAARQLSIHEGRPIVLVAHLRKRDRFNDDLIAGLDEFHGSSDLTKIATRVITIAPGGPTDKGNFETFFRIPKNRSNGGVTRFCGRCIFSPKRGGYEAGYKIGWADQSRKNGFAEIDRNSHPDWVRRSTSASSSPYPVSAGEQAPTLPPRGSKPAETGN